MSRKITPPFSSNKNYYENKSNDKSTISDKYVPDNYLNKTSCSFGQLNLKANIKSTIDKQPSPHYKTHTHSLGLRHSLEKISYTNSYDKSRSDFNRHYRENLSGPVSPSHEKYNHKEKTFLKQMNNTTSPIFRRKELTPSIIKGNDIVQIDNIDLQRFSIFLENTINESIVKFYKLKEHAEYNTNKNYFQKKEFSVLPYLNKLSFDNEQNNISIENIETYLKEKSLRYNVLQDLFLQSTQCVLFRFYKEPKQTVVTTYGVGVSFKYILDETIFKKEYFDDLENIYKMLSMKFLNNDLTMIQKKDDQYYMTPINEYLLIDLTQDLLDIILLNHKSEEINNLKENLIIVYNKLKNKIQHYMLLLSLFYKNKIVKYLEYKKLVVQVSQNLKTLFDDMPKHKSILFNNNLTLISFTYLMVKMIYQNNKNDKFFKDYKPQLLFNSELEDKIYAHSSFFKYIFHNEN